MDPMAYVRVLKRQSADSIHGWHIVRLPNPSVEDEKAKLKSALEVLGASDLFELAVSGRHPTELRLDADTRFGVLLDLLASELLDDVGRYTQNRHTQKLAATALVFLPMRTFAGYCIDSTASGDRLDGYVIALHEGLYFSLKLLAKAFVLESLEGDLTQYKGLPHLAYAAATECFLRPHAALLNSINFADVPPELDGVLSTIQSHAALVVLQFVALHEFAHIAADDFSLMDSYAFHVARAEPDPLELDAARDHWHAEYRADETALRWLCSADRTPESHWTNFIVIYAFFLWLADIETRIGRPLCPVHPPPAARADRLLAVMNTCVDGSDDARHRVAWMTRSVAAWATASRRGIRQ